MRGEKVRCQDAVLNECLHGKDVVDSRHEGPVFCTGELGLRKVEVHFVAVKVGVVRRDGFFGDQECSTAHNFDAVCHQGPWSKSWCSVESTQVVVDHVAHDDVADFQVDCLSEFQRSHSEVDDAVLGPYLRGSWVARPVFNHCFQP